MLMCACPRIVATSEMTPGRLGSDTTTRSVIGAYCTSKHALAGLTKSAAIDYANQNIRVNMLAPGPVDTFMTQQGALATPEGRRMVANLTPMQRIANPEEMADVVLWLASAKSSYVTGVILPADGGYTLP